MRALAAMCLALSLLTGCVSGGTAPDFQVRIDVMETPTRSVGYGQGVLIDAHHVVTVQHVAPKKGIYRVSKLSQHLGSRKKRIRYVKATFVGLFSQGRSVENLVVLRLEEGIGCGAYPQIRPVGPGDSGGPIMGRDGAVVGFVTGNDRQYRWLDPGRRPAIIGTVGSVGPIPREFSKKRKK